MCLVIRQDLEVTFNTNLIQPTSSLTSIAMLSNARIRVAFLLTRRAQSSARRSYAYSANDKQEIIDPNHPKIVPDVSKTNELPIETSTQDVPLQESVEEGEKSRAMQAPNRPGIWSRSQNPRAKAMTGPRFEQTIMKVQVS
jgi:NADH dehydrogenase (ubiquinone) Fe-S protein 6